MKINKSDHEISKKLKRFLEDIDEMKALSDISCSNMKKVRNTLTETVAFMEKHNENEFVTSMLPQLNSLNDSLKAVEQAPPKKDDKSCDIVEDFQIFIPEENCIFEDSAENKLDAEAEPAQKTPDLPQESMPLKKHRRRSSKVNRVIENLEPDKAGKKIPAKKTIQAKKELKAKQPKTKPGDVRAPKSDDEVSQPQEKRIVPQGSRPPRKSKLACLETLKSCHENEIKAIKAEAKLAKENKPTKVSKKGTKKTEVKVKEKEPVASIFSFTEEGSTLTSSFISEKDASLNFKDFVEKLV